MNSFMVPTPRLGFTISTKGDLVYSATGTKSLSGS
jgi:hypothetical protein